MAAQPPVAPSIPAGAAASATKTLEFKQAMEYVAKIKTRFVGTPAVYAQFLDILHEYQGKQKSIPEVYVQIRQLFAEHADLIDEFKFFLPPSSVPAA